LKPTYVIRVDNLR